MMDDKPAVQRTTPSITQVSMKELEARLRDMETRHGMSSEAFHRQACAGLLDEQDDYITWLGYYEAYLRLHRDR